ncbi:hypothetical protein [Flavobacterium sp. JP2137]|uniref:hypothetical protein n=1 Tax=Flavobacterium sp. JP2137 TaxID=3414510 RepID=UPI003D300E4A
MKPFINTMAGCKWPAAIEQKIRQLTAAGAVELLLYSKASLGHFNSLIIVCGGQLKSADIAAWNREPWCRDSVEQHGLSIALVDAAGLRSEADLHFAFTALNAQDCDVVYAANKKSYKHYGLLPKQQHFTKCKRQLQRWLDRQSEAFKEDMALYVYFSSQQNQGQAAYRCLQILLQKQLQAFQSFLLPKAIHWGDTHATLNFLKAQLPGFPFYLTYQAQGWADLTKLLHAQAGLEEQVSDFGTLEHQRIRQLLQYLQAYLNNELAPLYTKELKKKLARNQIYQIEQRLRSETQSKAQILQRQLVAILREDPAIMQLYLVACKGFDQTPKTPLGKVKRGRHFIVLVIGDQLKAAGRTAAQQLLQQRLGSAVKITLLYHPAAEILEGLARFQTFYKEVFTAKRCLFSRTEAPLGSRLEWGTPQAGASDYQGEQLRLLQASGKSLMELGARELQDAHIPALRQLFLQCAWALCYKQIHYLPSQLGLSESWLLIQWFLPDFKPELIGGHWEQILRQFDADIPSSTPVDKAPSIPEFFAITKKIYRYTERHLLWALADLSVENQ